MQQTTTVAKPLKSVLPEIRTTEYAEGVLLVDQAGSWQQVWILSAIAFGWNAFISIFICVMIVNQEWFPLACVVTIFGGLGLVLVWAAIQKALTVQRLAPGELVLGRWPLLLGMQVPITFRRRFKRPTTVERIEAKLICTEVATYTQGTNTRTVRERLWEEPLPEVIPTQSVEQCEARWQIRIPPDAPPSFTAYRNAIEWSVEVKLHITNFPDDMATFPLLVRPEVYG